MQRSRLALAAAGLLVLAGVTIVATTSVASFGNRWSEQQRQQIASLLLDRLPAPPADASNRYADSPQAARLGEALFNDRRLSSNGKVACATCHIAGKQFQDGTPLGQGVGQTNRRTMPISGTAYAPFLFWDGRKDSQWSQALGPLESAVEHGSDRTALARQVVGIYGAQYKQVFGSLPELANLPDHAAPEGTIEAKAAWSAMREGDRDTVNRVFSNIGKAMAAFERTIMPRETRFDLYAREIASGQSPDGILDKNEIEGLAIFIGKGNCVNCHNGPLLTDNHFHNTGVPAVKGLPEDTGRALGAKQVRQDVFNCLGPYSDARPEECGELNFMRGEGEDLLRAYKPPSLRNVTQRPPYMHAGQFASIDAVLSHYNRAPDAKTGHSELRPLGLEGREIAALKAFLGALTEE